MNTNEFYSLVEHNFINLAAAYAILMNNGDCILLRTFDDILNLTYRLKVAEKIIENESETEKIIERIEWYKNNIKMSLVNEKTKYVTILISQKAKVGCNIIEYYKSIIKVIDEVNEYNDFYEWIEAINSI